MPWTDDMAAPLDFAWSAVIGEEDDLYEPTRTK